jgi:hypothetical protein
MAYYTVAADFELRLSSEVPVECNPLPVFSSQEDATEFVKKIQPYYSTHISVYKIVEVATYRGKKED